MKEPNSDAHLKRVVAVAARELLDALERSRPKTPKKPTRKRRQRYRHPIPWVDRW